MRATTTLLVASFASLVGCAASGSSDETPPTLEVTSPARGTTNDSDTVSVTGKVTDDGPVQVTVNGVAVTPNADGTFSTTITGVNGLGIVETLATDTSGNVVRDVRAVLAGQLEATDGSFPTTIGARAGATALQRMGSAMGDAAEAIDFTAAGKAMNPIYNNDGCLGAKVDITSISLSNINVILQPKTNIVDADIELDNLVVKMHADYEFSCIGGSTNITLKSSKVRLGGNLGMGVESGKLASSLDGVTVALDGFSFDVSGVPGAVEDMLRGEVRSRVESALISMIKSKVPPIANKELAKLVAKPFTTDIIGHETTFTVEPAQVSVSSDGLFVAIDTTMFMDGAEGGQYVSNPMPLNRQTMPNTQGFGVAISDDGVNQLLASLWAVGTFDVNLPIEQISALAAIFDPNTKTIDVHLSLPPMMAVRNGAPELAVGDLIVTMQDASGAALQKMALSITTSVVAEPSQSNKVLLTLGEPVIKAQIMEQLDSVKRPLDDATVEGILSGVWGLVGQQAGDALAKLPMPNIAGLELGAPNITGVEGFLVGDMAIR